MRMTPEGVRHIPQKADFEIEHPKALRKTKRLKAFAAGEVFVVCWVVWLGIILSFACGKDATVQEQSPQQEQSSGESLVTKEKDTIEQAKQQESTPQDSGELSEETRTSPESTPEHLAEQPQIEASNPEKPSPEGPPKEQSTNLGRLITTLQVKEPAGVSRAMATVKTGVPFPRGELGKSAHIALYVQGEKTPLPLQRKILSVWGDGSIRWLLIATQLPLKSKEVKTLELRMASQPTSVSRPLTVTQKGSLIVVQTGTLQLEIPTTNGSLLHSVKMGTKTLLAPPKSNEQRGPWVKHNNGKTFWGALLKSTSVPKSNAPILGYRKETSGYPIPPNIRDPWKLSVKIEEQGPLYAVVRVSGAHLNADGTAFCHFVTRLHAFRGQSEIQLEHTFVYTGNGDRDRVEGYGLGIPYQGTKTLLDDVETKTGTVVHLQANQHTLNGSKKTGRSLGILVRESGQSGLGIVLRDMALHFPKALVATSNGLDVQLYPEAAPAWNLARYSKTNSNGETGRGDNQGAQGLSKSDDIFIKFSTSPIKKSALQEISRRVNGGPLLALAPSKWYSDARVMGIGAFVFDTRLNSNQVHYRIDRILHIIADFMRYNQRKQFNWFGLENYGDIRGLFKGGCPNRPSACVWSTKGRYGWSGNSGEPSNQLWVQFLRSPSRAIFLDAEALARHSLDVQMVHYADGVSQGIKRGSWSGLNREFSIGSLHRHGQQAWSGYAGQPEYSHIGGIETYYYLTGSGRAKEALYEAASFVTRFGGSSISSTRGNGFDVLSRAAAVFFDDTKLQTVFQQRIQRHINYWNASSIANEVDGKSGPPFQFFVRIAPGLLYHQERTAHQKLGTVILDFADKIIANQSRWGGLGTKHSANGEFFHLNLLAYAATFKSADKRSRKPYRDLAKKILELNCHNTRVSGTTEAIPLDSFKRIPKDWRSWTWRWKSGLISQSAPELLAISRDLTFRNDYMQDYHSYRLFIHLATLAAAIPTNEPGLQAK